MVLKQSIWDIIHNVLTTTINMGMNIPEQRYYSELVMYNDLQKTANEFLSSDISGDWDTGMMDEIPLDSAGYPLELPVATSNGQSTWVKYLITNIVAGEHILYFDGTGTFGGVASLEGDGYYHINFTGTGSNTVIDILTSAVGDPIRNIRVVPAIYSEVQVVPLFRTDVLTALDDFKVLRCMSYTATNNCILNTQRVLPTYFTQSRPEVGACYEHSIELAEITGKDLWINVPHMASDDYITEMATLFRDTLDPSIKIYLEYSNELWNWQFDQAIYVLENAPGATDQYVMDDLNVIDPTASTLHPEKDAYMHARTFRLWTAVFGGEMSTRVIRVAAVQGGYVATVERVVEYLFLTDGIGADVLSPTAYFPLDEEVHDKWLVDFAEDNLTYDSMYTDIVPYVEDNTKDLLNQAIANLYNIPMIAYEGGQHMQPYNQQDWNYSQMLWDFQIQPQMYELYKKNFERITSNGVDFKLFTAFSFVGERESKYGSWGHLETMNQIGGDYTTIAPKYQALLDFAKE
jgi:hypothetical protein